MFYFFILRVVRLVYLSSYRFEVMKLYFKTAHLFYILSVYFLYSYTSGAAGVRSLAITVF